jgi:integrase
MTSAMGEGADPRPVNGKVTPPRRVANRERRSREHLTPQEVDRLIKAASRIGRYGHRDATLILLAYRHGFRVSELVALRWDQVDFDQGLLYVSRLKNGVSSTHPLRGPDDSILHDRVIVLGHRVVKNPRLITARCRPVVTHHPTC